MSERVVPKNQFLRRILVFYPENIENKDNDWARETLNVLQGLDLKQDIFVNPLLPHGNLGAMKDAGIDDGYVPTQSLQRKMARDGQVEFFLTSTINHDKNLWIYTSELHESESSSDLPIMELTSSDLEAVKSQVKGLLAITLENNWEKAAPLFDDAVSRDSGYALAQFLRSAVYQTLGDMEKSNEAINAAMQNLYRVPERTGFMIKSQYYYNRQEVDKSMAVLKMWSKIYPNDSEAYDMQALYSIVRQDLPSAIAAYEKIMDIDPGQVRLVRKIATLQQLLGNFEEAEKSFFKFVEMYPTDTGGYRDLAECYMATGKFDKAREALENAQLIDPSELDLILGLVDVDIRTGKFEKSEKVLKEELARVKTARDRIKVLTRQMVLTELLGHSDQLTQFIESYHFAMLEIHNPLQADLMYSMLLTSLSNVGQPAVSLEKIEAAAAKITPPHDKLAGVSRAWALVSLGRIEEAKVALAEATDLAET